MAEPNVDPGSINPCLLILGCSRCSPPKVINPHQNQGHPHINKQGLINPGSTLGSQVLGVFFGGGRPRAKRSKRLAANGGVLDLVARLGLERD